MSEFQEVAIWNISESIEELKKDLDLNAQEQIELHLIKHAKGQKQWLASRNLAKKILKTGDQILYNDLGVPFLKDHPFHISFSHSENKVAISCNRLYETGIDIQYENNKIQKIQGKFVSQNEMKWIENGAKNALLHLLWGAKEALFKYYTTEMPFKTAQVERFQLAQQGDFEAVRKSGHLTDRFRLTYRIFEGYYLVYISDIISIEHGIKTNTKKEK